MRCDHCAVAKCYYPVCEWIVRARRATDGKILMRFDHAGGFWRFVLLRRCVQTGAQRPYAPDAPVLLREGVAE